MEKEKKKRVVTKYKCPICKETDSVELLTQHESYKRRYLHPECLEKHLEKVELEKIEEEEKNSMYTKFSEVYGIQNYEDISSRIYGMFSKLRAGNPVFSGKGFDKRYREGFSYAVIERTIVDCEDRIKYSLSDKDFQSVSSAMYYGIKIIVDRIPTVSKKYERELRAKAVQEERKNNPVEVDSGFLDAHEEDPMERFKRNKKRTNERDISSFLSEEE